MGTGPSNVQCTVSCTLPSDGLALKWKYWAFSQMSVQASCGQQLAEENCFLFYMLSLSRLYSIFWMEAFHILAYSLGSTATHHVHVLLSCQLSIVTNSNTLT